MPRDKQTYKDAAIRLKARREAKGISVPEFAHRLGVSTARYRTWEKIFGPLPQRQYGDAIERILSDDWEALSESTPSQPDEDAKRARQSDCRTRGTRAQSRREFLGLPRSIVAKKISMSEATLVNWEQSVPPAHRGETEDAWEDALQVPRGWLRGPYTEEIPLAGRTSELGDVGCLTVEDEIRAVAAWLTRAKLAKRTWSVKDLSEPELKRATMFADRYGVSGDENTTLQTIGDKFGLTRERARQVIEGMTERSKGAQFDLPKLSKIKEAAASHQLWLLADFEQAHRDLLGQVSLVDADRFAREILGFGVATITEREFGHNINSLRPTIMSNPDLHETLVSVRTAALRTVRSCGAAHVMFVTGLASEIIGKAVSVSDVRASLAALEGMEWLTASKDWFWLGADTANNRVLESVRKVLATAARRVDVEDLHGAVCRSRRAHYYQPDERPRPPEIEVPQDVLREILMRVPWLSVVQMNDFILSEQVAMEDVLNSSELMVIKTIEEHGGAAARHVFNKRFVDTGIFTLPNLQIVLSSSPAIKQLCYGVYGIRGKELPSSAFSEAVASLGKFAQQSAPADTGDGWCEFTVPLSEAGLRNGALEFPAAAMRVIPRGLYNAEGLVDGTFSAGTLPSAPTRTSGLVALLRRAGIKPGGLTIRIHGKTMRASICRTAENPSGQEDTLDSGELDTEEWVERD